MAGRTLGAKRKRSGSDTGRKKRAKLARTISITAPTPQAKAASNILGLRSRSAVLRYGVTNQGIGFAGGSVGSVVYNANSLYDPEVALGGGQPRGFDQMMALFDRYCVTGVKIEAWFFPPTYTGTVLTSTAQPMCGILYSERNDTLDAKYCLESANTVFAKQALGPPVGSDGATEVTAGPSQYCEMYVDLVKMKGNGVRRIDYINEESHQGTDTTSPDDIGYLKIFGFQPGDVTGGSQTVKAMVRLTYYATFTEPKMPAAS